MNDEATLRLPLVRVPDPIAVAIGNGSLLGIGYLMLRRWWLAAAAVAGTVLLGVLLVTVAPAVWFEAVIVLWWAALVVHGWLLAGGRRRVRRGGWWRRLPAGGVTLLVLASVLLLRWDDGRIDAEVAAARAAGDCPRAMSALDGRWLGDRLADAPLSVRGDATVRACELLADAGTALRAARHGPPGAVRTAYRDLFTVLDQLPGHQPMVAATLDVLLRSLPTGDPCGTAGLTTVLHEQRTAPALHRAGETVARVAPTALVDCGDHLAGTHAWDQATQRYRQLLDQYPGHPLTARATAGITRATQGKQLDTVRHAVSDATPDTMPSYCDHPSPYSAAAPFRPAGGNHVLLYGTDEYRGKLPPQWLAHDVPDATLIGCACTVRDGAPVQTCPYTPRSGGLPGGFPVSVTFHRIAIPVRIYELRTARLLAETTVDIGGASCPAVVHYETYLPGADLGPPPDMPVTPSNGDVQAAFAPVLHP